MPLATLFVRDFAIVQRLDLEFSAGLTVLTGETGAGKSIMVDALALALGERADNDLIRHGSDSAEVLASFDLDPGDDASYWLSEHELADDGACITRRVTYRDRPSRAFINGRPATAQALKELGGLLVDIHGQHEHQSLLRRETQRQILDDYAGLRPRVDELADHYRTFQDARDRFEALSRRSEDAGARADTLRYQVNELETLALKPGEYAELEQEHKRLAHASDLIEGLQAALLPLYDADDGTAAQILAHCAQRLDALAELAPDLAESAGLLRDAQVQVEEAASRLRHQLDRSELDPQRLNWVEQRIRAALDLSRKHRCEPDALPDTLAALGAELAEVEDVDGHLDGLRQRTQEARQQYQVLADEISAARREAGALLSERVSEGMQELGMRGGRFDAAVTSTRGEPTRYGQDVIEFLVSANPGQPLKPLARVASGGELSRICLAIQVVAAAVGRVPCLIFDEVDVGIGGRVAEIVGQKLRSLGAVRQVLCITHLPQVASQGDQHLKVFKREAGDVKVDIDRLDEGARVEEIARMLGGVEITQQTRDHARDMLQRAVG